MAISVLEKKLAVIVGWDISAVQGSHVSVSALNPAKDEVLAEKANTLNDGVVSLTFPANYTGKCSISVRGSSAGEEKGSITI